MHGKYFVLYERDAKNEKNWRMLFVKLKSFSALERAIIFAESNLPAIVAKKLPVTAEELRGKSKPYVVVGEYYGKYKHYDYGGGCDWVRTYDVVRTDAEEMEAIMEQMFNEEHLERIYRGLELKVI